jgi:hypothetical protein
MQPLTNRRNTPCSGAFASDWLLRFGTVCTGQTSFGRMQSFVHYRKVKPPVTIGLASNGYSAVTADCCLAMTRSPSSVKLGS